MAGRSRRLTAYQKIMRAYARGHDVHELQQRITDLERELDEAREVAREWRDKWGCSTGHRLPMDFPKTYPLPWETKS